MIGDAEPRRLDHGDVVCAVPGHEGRQWRDAEPPPQLDQRGELGLAPEDRLHDLSSQPPAGIDHERVGAVLVKADHGGDALREQRKAAGHEAGIDSIAAHCGDERACARREADPFGDDLVGDRCGQAFEQRHPLAQRRREFDLAAHRALGNGSHFALDPDVIRKLIDAFLPYHGRVHVGQKKPLAPATRVLQQHVDRRAGEGSAHAFGQRALVVCLGILRAAGKGNIDCNAGIEPDRRLR